MRHILSITVFIATFLVPSLAQATYVGGGGGNGSEGSHERMRERMKRSLAKKERKAFNKAYGALDEAGKTNFTDIVKSAVGEDMLQINQSQLVGFMGFVNSNPTATCNVINATKADMKSAFSLLSKKDQKRAGVNSKQTSGGGGSSVGIAIRPALMCTAGEVKKLFTGLPASTLNKFYNTNIQLASESTGTGTTGAAPAPTTASTQPATGYGNYMTQSSVDAQGAPIEGNVFTQQTEQREPASESGMHFSAGVSK